ncbi:MAG: hypothetical protein ACK520_14750 [Inhella sp.]|jgi:hypothetical protein|nr:hypothetical protein [Inhella sp.]MCZ8235897.1 hypothetical protein [Inhella sp.]
MLGLGRVRRLVGVGLLAALAACSQPIPADKRAYVGDWRGAGMQLSITAEGSVRYWRQRDDGSTTLEAPLQRFDGDHFDVGVGPISTRFVVTQPPVLIEGVWRMTVDGVALTRPGVTAPGAALRG